MTFPYPRTVWIVGESDDHLEAAFTTEAAADAYLAKIRERDGTTAEVWQGGTYYNDFWWMTEVSLDPIAPGERDPLQGLGGLR